VADLRRWAERISREPWEEAFVYFKHEDEARGPAFALALRDILPGDAAAHSAPPDGAVGEKLTATSGRC
jgi:hypothetical protein